MSSLNSASVFSNITRIALLLPRKSIALTYSPARQFLQMRADGRKSIDMEDVGPNQVKSKSNTHIERTSSQSRQKVNPRHMIYINVLTIQGFFLTRIAGIRVGTPSVRLIDLKLIRPPDRQVDCLPYHRCEEPQLFTFKPGQWIDTYVPNLPNPGGFSFVSTPKTFLDSGLASLAIQNTDNPPSKWFWQDGIIGQYVMIRVGGNFTFPPSPPSPSLDEIHYLQFIAGGVGIK